MLRGCPGPGGVAPPGGTDMTAYTVHELVVPATMDDDPGTVQAFREWVAVPNARRGRRSPDSGTRSGTGRGTTAVPAIEPGRAEPTVRWSVTTTGRAVAAGSYDTEAGTADARTAGWRSASRPSTVAAGSGRSSPSTSRASPEQQGRTQWKTYAVSRQVGSGVRPRVPAGAHRVRRRARGRSRGPVPDGPRLAVRPGEPDQPAGHCPPTTPSCASCTTAASAAAGPDYACTPGPGRPRTGGTRASRCSRPG